MEAIDYFAWFIFILSVLSVVGIFVFLGLWPIRVAQARRHPQYEAIQVASWAALIMGGAFWPLVLVWAHLRPLAVQGDGVSGQQVEATKREGEPVPANVSDTGESQA